MSTEERKNPARQLVEELQAARWRVFHLHNEAGREPQTNGVFFVLLSILASTAALWREMSDIVTKFIPALRL